MLEVKILEVSVTQMGFAIVLQPMGRSKVVPIFIGPLETYSISSALEGQKSERPMTHDLIKTILVSTNYKIDNELNHKESVELDARPSDSIAMAIRFSAPIFMDEAVYEKVSVDLELIKDKKIKENKRERENESLISEDDENLDHELIQTILDEFADDTPKWNSKQNEQNDQTSYKSKKEVLEQMLQTAIKKEKYEEAANIRDEIKKIEEENVSN
jgi:bifunctional DNase/RNase